MKKIKKAQDGNIVKFFDGQVENAETIDLKEYLAAKDAYLKGKKLEGNKVYDNWDKYNYARQYFETNPEAKSATIGTTYDKYGNRWDDQIIDALTPISKKGNQKSKLLEPTGEIANYFDKNRPLTGSQIVELNLDKKRKGGIIEDNRGQWAHPGKVTKINSNNITMKGVDYPVLGVSNKGDKKLMIPNKDYKFKGNSVTEYPIMQEGGFLENAGLGLLENANSLVGGIGMLKQQKQQRKALKQGVQLSELTKQVSELNPQLQPRQYVRPEDNLLEPNNLMPSFGTGSNFLAKNGKSIKKAQLGDTLQSLNDKNIGNVLGSYFGGGTGQVSGESMVGKGIGGTLGNIILPGIGGKIGGALGSLVGGVVGAEGQKDQLFNEQQINRNLTTAAFNQGNRNSPFMKNGGTTELNGELQTLWGGDVEPISENPYLPDTGKTVMFKGNSHDTVEKGKSGIGVKFGNSMVEVEGGEPAVKTKNNDLTVFGNMKIPSYGVSELQDKNAKGKKFKTYVADLSKKEDKQNKIINDFTNKLDTEPVITPFDKLSFNSSKSMIKGADMNLKEIAAKKQIASGIQNAILETAEENNLDSDQLAKGKFKKAKKSTKTAAYGDEINLIDPPPGGKIKKEQLQTYLDDGYVQDLKRDPSGNTYVKAGKSPINTSNESSLYKSPYKVNTAQKSNFTVDDIVNNPNKFKTFHTNMQGAPQEEILKAAQILHNKGIMPGKYSSYKENYITPGTKEQVVSLEDELPTITVGDLPPEEVEDWRKQKKQKSNIPWMDMFNSALPYFRPSNQQPLDPNQLSGEIYALSNNQIEPVQAQKYSPLLEQATDISLQDQLNANQSDFNSIKRLVGNNPAALSSIAAQKYAANSGVLGEQFRINQNQKLSTYNKNREILNDATLKNLAILDQQYTRQSQAKSNTKAVAQQALNSIADKIAKNKLENRTLGIYENLYNYRYLPNGQAVNLNPLAKWNKNGDNLPTLDEKMMIIYPLLMENGDVTVTEEYRQKYDKMHNLSGSEKRSKTTSKPNHHRNGSVVKAIKGY